MLLILFCCCVSLIRVLWCFFVSVCMYRTQNVHIMRHCILWICIFVCVWVYRVYTFSAVHLFVGIFLALRLSRIQFLAFHYTRGLQLVLLFLLDTRKSEWSVYFCTCNHFLSVWLYWKHRLHFSILVLHSVYTWSPIQLEYICWSLLWVAKWSKLRHLSQRWMFT